MKYTRCLKRNLRKYLLEAHSDKLDNYLKKKLENNASIAGAIWVLYERNYSPQFEHKMMSDSFYLTREDEKTLFNNVTTNINYPGTLDRLNLCLGLLEKTWAGSSGVARGFRFTPEWLQVLSEIERKTGYTKPKIPFDLAGDGIAGKTTWKYMPNKYIHVDESGLQVTCQPDSQKHNYYRRKYYRQLKERNGYLRNSYQEKSSGRVYGGIQNMPKIVREEFFAGWYEYDMECAHYSMLLALKSDLVLGVRTPCIEQYVNNSGAIRREVANEIGCSERDVKIILIAIGFGANIRNPNSKAFKKIDNRHIRGLTNHEFILMFEKEAKLLGKEIINKYTDSSSVVNARGKHLIHKNNNFGAKLSHILQSWESVFLETVLAAIGDREAILIHDAFLMRRDLNPDVLSEIIVDKFGMDIRFSKKLLGGPNPSGIASVPLGAFHTFAVTNTPHPTIALSKGC